MHKLVKHVLNALKVAFKASFRRINVNIILCCNKKLQCRERHLLVNTREIHPLSQSVEPDLAQSQSPQGQIQFQSNWRGFQRVNLHFCEHTHTRPVFRHTNKLKHEEKLHTGTCSLSALTYAPLHIHRKRLYRSLRSSLLPTSYCLLLSTDEQAPASVAKGTGLNQMKPTGTEWHSHASVATDELTHTHTFIHKQKLILTQQNRTHAEET